MTEVNEIFLVYSCYLFVCCYCLLFCLSRELGINYQWIWRCDLIKYIDSEHIFQRLSHIPRTYIFSFVFCKIQFVFVQFLILLICLHTRYIFFFDNVTLDVKGWFFYHFVDWSKHKPSIHYKMHFWLGSNQTVS
jgi:hypothetical protein